MNKFLGLIFALLFSITAAFSADLRFVQVDDLFFKLEDKPKFETVIKEINSLRSVDFIVFSGDNIERADKQVLETFLKTAKKLKKPYYIILGSNDVNKRKDLSKAEYMETVSKYNFAHRKIKNPNYVFEKKGVVFIVVDGSKEVIKLPNGYFKPEVLSWLDEQLNIYKDKTVIILQHYPIVPPVKKESYYTYKAEDYLKMLSKHKNVKAVVSGHFNAFDIKEFNKVYHISAKAAPEYMIHDIIDVDINSPMFFSMIKELKY